MADFTLLGREFEMRAIGRNAAEDTFSLQIEYVEEGEEKVDSVELRVQARGDITNAYVQDKLGEWMDDHATASEIEFEVIQKSIVREGEECGVVEQSETDIDDLVVGERVAYYVGGPNSSVYGYVSEGVVEALPPWGESDHTGEVKMRLEDHWTAVPVQWILGPADEPEIAEQIDQERDLPDIEPDGGEEQ